MNMKMIEFYLAYLHERGLVFHFDDEVKDCPRLVAKLTINEALKLQQTVDDMYEWCENNFEDLFVIYYRLYPNES